MLIVLAIDYFMQLGLDFYLFFMISATFSGFFVVLYASLHSITHFKVDETETETEKSKDRKLLERKVSFRILTLRVIGLFIYFLYSGSEQLRDSITGLMLAIGSGLYAKLLEKEFSFPSSVKYKAKETAFVIGLGILYTSIYYLAGSK
jgi:hypothetical protein